MNDLDTRVWGFGLILFGIFSVAYHLGYDFMRSGSINIALAGGWPIVPQNIMPAIVFTIGLYLLYLNR